MKRSSDAAAAPGRHSHRDRCPSAPRREIVYIRIVTFGLANLPIADYRQHAAAVAGGFTAWPGLLEKIWLADERRNRFGGVYVFESQDDADRSRSTALFAGLVANPAFTDLVIDEYDTLPEPTAITCPPVRPGTRSPSRLG
jgi:hypothetical protein